MTLSILRGLQRIQKEIKAATKAGDTAAALAAQERLNEAIKAGVNSPLMPRAAPLTDAQIRAYAERMAPQIAGELTRQAKGAKTLAGKSQKQFKREQTLPVQREVVEGAVDPMAPLTPLTLEEQRGGVLLGLPGDPSLARVKLSGIGDVEFERPVTLHGGPRYGDEDKLWASNLSAASGLLGAAGRASKQYGEAPVIASYTKMPSGLPFAQHYLESLLQYQRPDLLGKQARAALEKDIRSGYVNAQKKRVTFPDFPGFGDMDAVMDAALQDSNLRKHIASRLEKSEKYGLRPAEDVQFAVSHPELTNLETGASGFTLGELPLGQALTESAHPTYSHDIAGKVIGQLRHPTPYDLLYRDQLELIRQNPKAPEFNTLKLLGARQQIDEQLINEINEYQERVRRLIGKKKGGLALRETQEGLAPHGIRHSGEGVKGSGYFGYLPAKEGFATEMSAEDESGEYPLLVPTLSKEEIEHLLAGNAPTEDIYRKAVEHAERRRKSGKSPFAEATGLKYPVEKADGGAVSFELPEDVTPQNWRKHLASNVLADAKALLGVKDGGAINVDELLAQAMEKHEPVNVDDLLDWAIAKQNHKMKKGGEVSQKFPLKEDEEAELKPTPKYPLAEKLSKGVGAVHEFVSKPFGFENPPGEMASELLGIPGVAKTLERVAYGDPLTSGAGMTTNLLPETTETLFAGLGAAPVVAKGAKVLAPTAAEMMEFQLAQAMKPYQMAVAPEGKAGKLKAPANPVGFYNPAEKAALNLQRKKGPGSAFISDLKKQPGVTDERLTELGLDELASRPNVTREEVVQAAEQNRIPLRETVRKDARGDAYDIQMEMSRLRNEMDYMDSESREYAEAERELDYLENQYAKFLGSGKAKFSPSEYPDYNMPGGENYREIRVGLPSSRPSIKNMSRAEYNAAVEKADREGVQDFMHQTHHGDEPNVLFHLRVADHKDIDGKRGLLIDELQSDWHQAGREHGYLRDDWKVQKGGEHGLYEAISKEDGRVIARGNTAEEANNNARVSMRATTNAVPNAPFKDNWYQLGLKRAIKEAADNGMDRVYLTTGARQADRYDLSKQIDSIEIYKARDKSEGYMVKAMKDGDVVIDQVAGSDEALANLIGKDLAKKAKDQRPGAETYSGLDLKVGGEGMKQYYDKTYKNFLDKYAKQFGGRVGTTKIADGETVYYIDINPKMIESAKKGQSYQYGGLVYNTDPDQSDGGQVIPEKSIL